MQMTLFAGYALLDKQAVYKKSISAVIEERYSALWKGLGLAPRDDVCCAHYYAQLDFLVLAHMYHGDEFVTYLTSHYEPVDLVFRLAEVSSLVVLNGAGFKGPKWSVRVSLANLNAADYDRIGSEVKGIVDDYAAEWNTRKSPHRRRTLD
jgi:aspartate 4-decarboxylase